MRRLHLKLFYLRTRYKREPQGITAKTLGVRPATMSHLEQGRSLPTLPMLMALCKHYDVTPTYLLDDERPIEPRSRDRLNESQGNLSRGDWFEVPDGAAVKAADGMWLCPVMSGTRGFDSTAQAQRMLCRTREEAERLSKNLLETEQARDRDLESQLRRELLGQRKPRRRSGIEAPAQQAAEA
ncbi:MAG: helix-turn-helix transcriptional regulator [Planctomycetota bacterium]